MKLSSLWFVLPALALAQEPGANYDESKVGDYRLPELMKLADGAMVRDADGWKRRRVEILRLFESQMYGRSAAKPLRLEHEITSRSTDALQGFATRKEVTIWLTGKKPEPKMSLLLYIPKERKGPAPVFLGLNFGGNHAIHPDPAITLSTNWMRPREGVVNNRATESTRGTEASRWQVEKVVRRGYAVASIYYGDIFPDHKDGLKDSILPHLYRPGQSEPGPEDWGAIGAWAWGLSRALDYMERDRDLDPRRVAVWGHSRLGKTSLWAGAQDERFALVISNNSGEGGAALARRNFGETVERINTSFPHWFCLNFKRYNKDVDALPVDQHMLIALMAPRPVYVASAQEDLWADPRGEFLAAKAAGPVYQLLGAGTMAAQQMPGVHDPVTSRIGYHIRAGKHDVTEYDWEQFLNFADTHMKPRR
jgi:hypothetical protein